MLVQKSRACSSAGLPDFIPKFRDSIVVSIPACHAGDPGSIPGPGVLFLLVNPRASKKSQVLPGLEPGLQGSKPWVLTNYTIEPCLRANFERLSLYKTKKQSKKVGSLIGHPAHVSTPTRFELARAEPIGFQNQLLNHSDTVSPAFTATAEFSTGKKTSTPTRFELARAEPSRFRIYLLNHSDTVSCAEAPERHCRNAKKFQNKKWFDSESKFRSWDL